MSDEMITSQPDPQDDSPLDDIPVEESSHVIDEKFIPIKEHYENDIELTDAEIDAIADVAVDITRSLLSFFGEDNVNIDEYEGDDGELILDVSNGDLAVLIGRHGKTLDSLQVIVSTLVNNKIGFHYPVVVDIEGYKNRRRQKLRALAKSSAARAKSQRGQVSLSPMSAYERRIIHITLVDDDEVMTHSEGEEPNRHVVITALKKQ